MKLCLHREEMSTQRRNHSERIGYFLWTVRNHCGKMRKQGIAAFSPIPHNGFQRLHSLCDSKLGFYGKWLKLPTTKIDHPCFCFDMQVSYSQSVGRV